MKYLKPISAFFILSFFSSAVTLYAQAPQSFSYQAVARDLAGNIIANKAVSLRFSILDGSSSGTVVYQETQSATTNVLGLCNVSVGQGTVTSGNFSTIGWGSGGKFLKVEIDPNGGSSYTVMGTTQMLSVPYALYAANGGATYNAGSGISLTGNTFSNNAVTDATLSGNGTAGSPLKIAQQGATTGQVLQWNGSSWTPATAGSGAAWNLTGNSGTNPSTNFLGTTDANDFVLKTNNTERMRVTSGGNIGIGTTSPLFALHAIGNAAGTAAVGVFSNTNATGNAALAGQNTAAAGTGIGNGLFGATQQSNGFGVYGLNLNPGGTGIIGLGNNLSGYTLPTNGAGGAFYGSLTGAYGYTSSAQGYGVYGRADYFGSAYGVVGKANNALGGGPIDGAGGAFLGNSYGVSGFQNATSGQTAGGYFVAGDGAGNPFSTTLVEAFSTGGIHYKIWQSVLGTVSTCVPDLEGNPATLHAIETPEFYFQDYGEGKLVNGKAHIDIDPILAKNVAINDKHPLRVFVQLEGDCKGVYVTNKTATGFDVVELNGGTSNVSFQWSITCNVADAKIGNRISPFADLRFEPGPIDNFKKLDTTDDKVIIAPGK